MTGERLYTGDTVTQLKIGDDDMSLSVSCAGYLSRSRGLVACVDAKDRDGFVGLALTAEEAKARLFAEVEAKTRHESAKMIRQIETEAKETADRRAKEILCNVIQRYAGDYVNEQTVTAVSLPSEDMK